MWFLLFLFSQPPFQPNVLSVWELVADESRDLSLCSSNYQINHIPTVQIPKPKLCSAPVFTNEVIKHSFNPFSGPNPNVSRNNHRTLYELFAKKLKRSPRRAPPYKISKTTFTKKCENHGGKSLEGLLKTSASFWITEKSSPAASRPQSRGWNHFRKQSLLRCGEGKAKNLAAENVAKSPLMNIKHIHSHRSSEVKLIGDSYHSGGGNVAGSTQAQAKSTSKIQYMRKTMCSRNIKWAESEHVSHRPKLSEATSRKPSFENAYYCQPSGSQNPGSSPMNSKKVKVNAKNAAAALAHKRFFSHCG